MKVALILPANRYFCPFHNLYIDILKKANCEYDVIFFDKENLNEDGVGYSLSKKLSTNMFGKFLSYYLYSRFVKRKIKENSYDKLVVFSSQLSLFLSSFLIKNYFSNFIIDFRDLSIEQRFKRKFKNIATASEFVVVSSPGFIPHLPVDVKYVLSHNSNDKIIDLSVESRSSDTIRILTIGALRDYDSNVEIIKNFKNDSRFFLDFVGKGPSEELLKAYCSENKVENVKFYGYYDKHEEQSFIKKAHILNIYYPRTKLHSSALSNRFYHGIFHRLPMICTNNSIQGDYIEKYNLGVSVKPKSNIKEEVLLYLQNPSYVEDIQKSSVVLLAQINTDNTVFNRELLRFLEK